MVKTCAQCKLQKQDGEFSSAQIKKGQLAKCRSCIGIGDTTSSSQAKSSNPSPSDIVAATQVHLEMWNQLIQDNCYHLSENQQLKLQLDLTNDRVQYLKKWDKEKDRLEQQIAESTELREQLKSFHEKVVDLQRNTDLLMVSFKNENKLAIRCMIDDAKTKGLETYSNNVQNIVKLMKCSVNSAAHSPYYFDRARIQIAINALKRACVKTVLQEMFNATYETTEEDDDFSEFDN